LGWLIGWLVDGWSFFFGVFGCLFVHRSPMEESFDLSLAPFFSMFSTIAALRKLKPLVFSMTWE